MVKRKTLIAEVKEGGLKVIDQDSLINALKWHGKLFTHINNDAKEGQFQVVVANNRDELYTRATKPASVWDSDLQCISGLDLHHDKDGHTHGTWIAMSGKRRKIASLINIMTSTSPDPRLKGRGTVVTDYVTGPQCACDFLQSVEHHDGEYNPFNLVILEERDGKWDAYYHNSGERQTSQVTSSVFGVASSPMHHKFKKVLHGEPRFEDIIQRNGRLGKEEILVEDILSMMGDKTSNLPDPVLSENIPPYFAPAEDAHSAICVDHKDLQYGTRTHTIILIDASGRGKYIEKTLEYSENGAHVWNTSTILF